MDISEKISLLESNLARQLSWISAAESKGSFIFAVDTALLGVLAAIAPSTSASWNIAPAIFASFTLLFAGTSLLFLSFASFPRTTGPKGSVIYFGGIVQRDTSQYGSAISELTNESYCTDLVAQCHRNAEIANQKFIWIQRALVCLYLSTSPWVAAIYLLYNGSIH